MRCVRHGGQHEQPIARIRRFAQLLESREHVRIRLAGDAHHLPVKPLGVNVRRGRDVIDGFIRRFLFLLPARQVFGVECAPSLLIRQIALELSEESGVQRNLAAFDALPGTVRARRRYAVIDPSGRDVLGPLVV